MPLKLTQTHQCAQCYGCDAEIKHRQPVSTCAPTHTHIHICTHTHTHTHTHTRTRMRPAMLYVMLKGSTGGLPSTNTPTYIHTHTHTHTNVPGKFLCDAERKHSLPAFYAQTPNTNKNTSTNTFVWQHPLSHAHTNISSDDECTGKHVQTHTHTLIHTVKTRSETHTFCRTSDEWAGGMFPNFYALAQCLQIPIWIHLCDIPEARDIWALHTMCIQAALWFNFNLVYIKELEYST